MKHAGRVIDCRAPWGYRFGVKAWAFNAFVSEVRKRSADDYRPDLAYAGAMGVAMCHNWLVQR